MPPQLKLGEALMRWLSVLAVTAALAVSMSASHAESNFSQKPGRAAPSLMDRLRLAQTTVWNQCTNNSSGQCGAGHRCCFYSTGNRCKATSVQC